MYNSFSKKKYDKMQIMAKSTKQKIDSISSTQKKRDVCAVQSRIRVTHWTTNNYNSNAARLIQKGCSSVKHPNFYEFRDCPEKGQIYIRQ